MAGVQAFLLSDLDHVQARVSTRERLESVLAGFRDRAEGRRDGPPPIDLITHIGAPLHPRDGNHRLRAARMLGLTSIEPFTQEIGEEEQPASAKDRRRMASLQRSNAIMRGEIKCAPPLVSVERPPSKPRGYDPGPGWRTEYVIIGGKA